MKKILYTLMVGMLTVAALSLFSACKESKESVDVSVSGFDVEATATAEIGDYYDIPVPNVSVSEGKFDLSISASKGDDELFVVNNRVLIMDFEPHTITYTLSYVGGEEVKTTTVTPIDTTVPVIKFFGLENTVYTNTAYDVSEIVADDNSFEQLSVQVKAVYVETQQELPISNDKFTTPDQSGATVRLETMATDSNGNTVTQTKDLYVVSRNDYGTLDTFDSQDITKYINTHTGTDSRTEFESVSSMDENEIQGIRGRALKIRMNEFKYGSKEAAFIKLDKNKLDGATAFDYLTFRMYIDMGTAIKSDQSTVAIKLKESKASGINRISGWVDYTIEKAYYPKNGEFIFEMAHWCDEGTLASFTVYIDEVTGGYTKNIYLGESVDMVEALGVDASQITGMQLQTVNGATLENSVFQCTQAGDYTIRVTVNKPPYNQTTFDYCIKVIKRSSYDDFLCLGEENVKNYIVTNENGSEITRVTKEIVDGTPIGVDGNVLRLETGTNVDNGKYFFSVPKIITAQLNSFDYYTIVGYVDCNRNGFRVSALSNGVEVPESQRLLDIKGRFEYRVEKEFFGEYLQFAFADWTGTASDQAKILYIISVMGGYNSVEKNTQLNLVEKTGLTADELSGTYFQNAGGTQTPISNLTAFTPTEAGEIVLLISKEGYGDGIVVITVNTNDFLLLDENDLTKYVVTEKGDSTSNPLTQVTKEIVDGSVVGEQGDVLKLKLMTNTNMCFHIPNAQSDRLDNFDYYTIVGYADCTRGGFRVASYDETATYLESEQLNDIKGKFEYKVKKEYFNEYLQFVICNQTGTGNDALQYLYIISITGGYNA